VEAGTDKARPAGVDRGAREEFGVGADLGVAVAKSSRSEACENFAGCGRATLDSGSQSEMVRDGA
jgi:hypothetical protein